MNNVKSPRVSAAAKAQANWKGAKVFDRICTIQRGRLQLNFTTKIDCGGIKP